MKIIVIWLILLDVSMGESINFSAKQVHSGQLHIIQSEKDLSRTEKVVYSRSELGSNVDTMFAGANFCILQHTTIYFDVSPYCENYFIVTL